jgi:hypothetical protein
MTSRPGLPSSALLLIALARSSMIVGEGGVTQAGGLASWLVLYLVSPDTSLRWEPALTPECRQFLSLDDVKVFLIGPPHPA